MTIAVNGMYLRYPLAGIAKFIIWGCSSFSKKARIIIFSNKPIEETIRNEIEKNNVEYCVKPYPYFNSTLLWFFFIFPQMVNSSNADVLWNPAVWCPPYIKKTIKKLVTIHDFVSTEYRNTMKFGNRAISTIIEKKSIMNADYLWTVSEYTKNKLIYYYPKLKNTKIFVGNAPSSFWCKKDYKIQQIEEYYNRFNINGDFFLFVGSLEPRKNLAFLLSVFKELSKKHNKQLVIVGASGWGYTGLKEIINSKNYPKDKLVFMPFISEEELRFLYNKAACYISTSINEGFGMPQAEAMKCGCPVVTAHNSAMIEVVSGGGITVEGWNIDVWCSSIEKALTDRENIVLKQFEKCKNYDWDTITSNFFDFING